MTGPEHFREAERLLADAESGADSGPVYFLDDAMPSLAAAQVHAALAHTAATALHGYAPDGSYYVLDLDAWYKAAGTKPAKASPEKC